MGGRVWRRRKVDHLSLVYQGEKPVRAARGQIDHPAVVRTELSAEPAPEARRAAPEIDNDIVRASCDATNELGFPVWRYLIVQAAQRPGSGAERVVDLGEIANQPTSIKFLAAIDAREESALILSLVQRNQEDPWYFGLAEMHAGLFLLVVANFPGE